MYIHLEQDKTIDPRVLRTREVLINSFAKLLLEQKSIRKVSVQNVTKLAGVNRVTFYAHFSDKFELLDVWARLMFKQAVVEKLPDEAVFDTKNLTLLIQDTLDFFTARNKYRRRINKQFESMFETAMQQELRSTLKVMLDNLPVTYNLGTADNIATFMSWALFGSLLDRSIAGHKADSNEKYTAILVNLYESMLAKATHNADTYHLIA